MHQREIFCEAFTFVKTINILERGILHVYKQYIFYIYLSCVPIVILRGVSNFYQN